MGLVGAWLRQLLGAGTAAALVPAAIIAALVVAVVGSGGLGGLGALGQVFAGPEVSPVHELASETTAGRELAPVAPAPTAARLRLIARSARSTTRAPTAPAPRRQPPRVVAPGPAPADQLPPPPAPAPAPPPVVAPPPPPPPQPQPRLTLYDRTKTLVQEVGETVNSAVDGIKGLVDGLGPPRGTTLGSRLLGR